MECVRCVCVSLSRRGRRGGEWMRGLVWALPILWEQGSVSVFRLRWCRWGVGRGLGSGSREVGWCYVCVSLDSLCIWQVQVSVYWASRIPAHLMCIQCSMLLHLIDICYIPCICLWQISQIQTCLCVVVGPGFVSTSPTFMRSSTSQPAGPHGRQLSQKRYIGPSLLGAGGFDTFCTAVCSRRDRPTACRLCRLVCFLSCMVLHHGWRLYFILLLYIIIIIAIPIICID